VQRSRIFGVAIALAAVLAIAVAGTAAGGRPESQPFGPPIGPMMAPDTGAGEQLILVVGGVYATRAEAEEANASMVFGDLQGYYVVPVGQFQGFQEQVGGAGDFALVSAFRTQEGANAFVELATTFGVPATVYPRRVVSLGGLYAGLGQEAAPDGSGPLLGPVRESLG
jgi:hypothetical protein